MKPQHNIPAASWFLPLSIKNAKSPAKLKNAPFLTPVRQLKRREIQWQTELLWNGAALPMTNWKR